MTLERQSKLKLGAVTIEDSSWICIFGCYHDIQEPRCDCGCHDRFKLILKRYGPIAPINLKRFSY